MKFNYIIGNPPYIGGLYKEIWAKIIKNIASKGRIQFITPVGFTRQSSIQDYKLRDYIQRYKTKITLYHSLDIFPVGVTACGGGITVTDIDFSKESKDITVHNLIDNDNDYQFQSEIIMDTIPVFKEQSMLMEKFKDLKKIPIGSKEFRNPYNEIEHKIPHRGGSRVQSKETPQRAVGYKSIYKKTEETESQVFYVEDHPFFNSEQNILKNKYTVVQHEMSVGNPVIIEPGTVFDELFYIIGVFNTLEESERFVDYIRSVPVQFYLASYVTTIKASRKPYYLLPTETQGRQIKYTLEEIQSMEKMLKKLKITVGNVMPFLVD